MKMIYFVLASSLLILFTLLMRSFFRKKLSPGVVYALWLIPYLRLLVPFGFVEVPMFGMTADFLNHSFFVQESLEIQWMNDENETADIDTEYVLNEESDLEHQGTKVYDAVLEMEENETEVLLETKADFPVSLKQVLFIIWILGAFIIGVYVIVQNRKLRKVADALEVVEQAEGIDICLSHEGKTPCLVGIINPKILIPPNVYENARLYRWAVLHELAHFHQKDHLWNAGRAAMCVLYWWNPLVWYAAKCAAEDAELACDARVLREASVEERKNYGFALLELLTYAQKEKKNLRFATSVSGNQNSMKRRIQEISNKTITKKYVLLPVALGLVLLLAAGCVYPSGDGDIKTDEEQIGEAAEQMPAEEVLNEEENTKGRILAQSWANAFVNKGVETIINLATDDVLWQLKEADLVDEEASWFGWSSPWPALFTEEGYQILSCDEHGAEILYYASLSTPHVVVWGETLEFIDGKVSAWTFETYDNISNLNDYWNAYPGNKISGTPMDYYTNGLGETLNRNALLSSSDAYKPLFDAKTAALDLLNISRSFALEYYQVEEIGDEAMVSIPFFNSDGSIQRVQVKMWQPYGKEGIWIPKSEENVDYTGNDVWSREQIKDIFLNKAEPDWELLDLVSMDDFAYDRVGVVLYKEHDTEFLNIGFMDKEGWIQPCGIEAVPDDNPEFTYHGNGEVTFYVRSNEGVRYKQKITFSADDDGVKFVSESILLETHAVPSSVRFQICRQ